MTSSLSTGSRPSPLDYRTSFAGPSVGTEQEFLGVRLGKARLGGSLIAEVVSDGALLVQITTDIGGGEDAPEGYLGYTMEIKTSPTEVGDEDGWGLRTTAIRSVLAAIAELVKSGSDTRSLTSGKLDDFDLVVHNAEHVFYKTDSWSSGVTSSSRHATYGLPFADLGTTAPGAQLVQKAHWYRDWSEEFDLITGTWVARDRALATYNYLRSVLIQLAELTTRYSLAVHNLGELKGNTGNLYDSPVKNAWGTLPRTAPLLAIGLLPEGDRERVKTALRARPGSVTDTQVWTAVVWHIFQSLTLAGHTPAQPTYATSKPGTLFEFRSGIPVAFKHAFVLIEGEAGGFAGEVQEAKTKKPVDDDLQSKIKALRPPGSDDSDDEEEESSD
ncbi:actin cross-linking domain-containing toxin [Actinokineospora diospyrosa]|uniref:Actin cross-linking domain-containing protein n=1 Tax=Actinokineospora diospyrosa TaxID=103728 RepID=A0ABT1IBC1_9PSEU|nr:actin cross-linking domain-containing toxin [Actinokineospora diospyrosa]MCP2269937.1 Actin cross-linking domain-containing protein [Actinokineospora diospyrosa]